MPSPSRTVDAAGGELTCRSIIEPGPHDRGIAPRPGDDRGVAHEPAAAREHAFGRLHAVDIVGRGLRAHQHRVLAAIDRGDDVVGVEVRPPTPAPGEAARPLATTLCSPVELRMQHLVEVLGCDPGDGLGAGQPDLRFGRHLDRHAQRRRAGPLAHTGLQHPELALLDGELGVEHVAVVPLEPPEDVEQLPVDRGNRPASASSGTVLRMPATTSSPWALIRKSP